jgi:hypothetical protein
MFGDIAKSNEWSCTITNTGGETGYDNIAVWGKGEGENESV